MRRNFLICLFLAGITLEIYWPARHYGVVYFDDPLFVTDTPEINDGLSRDSIRWAFTGIVAANWHPITSLSFILTHQWFGTSPGAEHIVNMIFHAMNAALLFLVLQRMTGFPWRSFAVAAWFAWHPLRVESVAWIAERKDVLCGFFFFLTLFFYARYAQPRFEGRAVFAMLRRAKGPRTEDAASQALGSRLWSLDYVLALLCFALALMSKAMAVTLPFVLLLLDGWPLQRMSKADGRGSSKPAAPSLDARRSTLGSLLFEKWPFFVLSAIFCVVTFWVQKTGAAMPSLDRTGFEVRLANVLMSYLRYLGKAVWPADLAMLYPFPVNERSYLALWPGWQIIAAAIVLLLVSILCVRQLARRPYLAVGWFWYLGMMLPVIGLVQVGGQGMADRYTYLPLIGPAIAVVWFAAEFFRSLRCRKILAVLAVLALTACAVLARQQLNYWRDTVVLFSHTADVTGDNFLGQLIIGDGLDHEGKIREAIVHYRMAVAINPGDPQGYRAVARMLAKEHRWAAAVEIYDSILETDPKDIIAHLGLATVLPHSGEEQGAIQHLETALHIDPDSTEALNNLAWTLATCPDANFRDGARAVQLAERACALTEYRQTIFVGTLAAAYAEAGRFDEAMAAAQKAVTLAEKNHEPELRQKNADLLELYRAHRPYHEAASPVQTEP